MVFDVKIVFIIDFVDVVGLELIVVESVVGGFWVILVFFE